jgi:glycosyltransferase involved in cell wall biosynthesis
MTSIELARRLVAKQSSVTCNVMNPGLIPTTGLFRDLNPLFVFIFTLLTTYVFKVASSEEEVMYIYVWMYVCIYIYIYIYGVKMLVFIFTLYQRMYSKWRALKKYVNTYMYVYIRLNTYFTYIYREEGVSHI